MAEIVIEAEPREGGSSNEARRMRRNRKLPAVVYGGDKETNVITLDRREITTILKSETGQNTIFKLKVGGGAPENVMIFDLQIDPISHHLQHADLVRIAMDQEIEVAVPIVLVGEAVGVRVDGGVLDHSLRELIVSCLPSDIPENIEVDVSEMEMNSSIKVEDIAIPPNVEVITDLDRSVASVVAPVSEEELEAAVEALEGEREPELVGEEGEEVEVPEEGEAPPAEEEGEQPEKKEKGGSA